MKKLTFDEALSHIKTINSPLFEILDRYTDKENCYFLLGSYEYGDAIVKDGHLALSSEEVQMLKNGFVNSESDIPLALSLNKAIEINYELQVKKYRYPINTIHPGNFFGLFEVLDNQYQLQYQTEYNKINLYAGIQTIFLNGTAPFKQHITKKMDFNFSKKVDWALQVKKILSDNTEHQVSWKANILFFSKEIIDFLFKEQEAMRLLFGQAWQQILINRLHFGLTNKKLYEVNSSKNTNDNFYLKHLVTSIKNGTGYCYIRADNNNYFPYEDLKAILDIDLLEQLPLIAVYLDRQLKKNVQNVLVTFFTDVRNLLVPVTDSARGSATQIIESLTSAKSADEIKKQGCRLIANTPSKNTRRYKYSLWSQEMTIDGITYDSAGNLLSEYFDVDEKVLIKTKFFAACMLIPVEG